MNVGYATAEYWNLRYKINSEPFEWYEDAKTFIGQVMQQLEEERVTDHKTAQKEFTAMLEPDSEQLTSFNKFEALMRSKPLQMRARRKFTRAELQEAWEDIAQQMEVEAEKKKLRGKKQKKKAVGKKEETKEAGNEPSASIVHTLDFQAFASWYSEFNGLPKLDAMRVLELGCGTSDVCPTLLRAGCMQVVGVDISELALEAARKRQAQNIQASSKQSAQQNQVEYRLGDTTNLRDMKDSSFDLILDKGALDCVLCSQGSEKAALDMLSECQRLLKPGGYAMVLCAGPLAIAHSRLPLFQAAKFKWTAQASRIGQNLEFWTMFLPA